LVADLGKSDLVADLGDEVAALVLLETELAVGVVGWVGVELAAFAGIGIFLRVEVDFVGDQQVLGLEPVELSIVLIRCGAEVREFLTSVLFVLLEPFSLFLELFDREA
jgi:hypothetical protein